jgi:hypothetical protein
VDRERGCQTIEDRDGWVLYGPFETADVSPVEPRIDRKVLLRNPQANPQLPQVPGNKFPTLHAEHGAS